MDLFPLKRFLGAAILGVALCGAASHADQAGSATVVDKQLDENLLPDELKPNYQLMLRKCTTCHGLERVITAVQTGIGPISRQSIDKVTVKPLVIKMMRKPGANMTKDDGKAILDLLLHLLEQAKR